MSNLNTAQQIYALLGVSSAQLLIGSLKTKSYSYTKKGPGRTHDKSPKAMKEEL